jgi:hypothetical protein
MSYPSIDALQKALSNTVFGDRTDTKKAAGRAMGTILEIISFYLIKSWGINDALTIELRIPEYGNSIITHNVEFSLHPVEFSTVISLNGEKLPFTAAKIIKSAGKEGLHISSTDRKNNAVLSSDNIKRNSAIIAQNENHIYLANLIADNRISISKLSAIPYAMVECKRVGVEDGAKKGPTTIEKAKQGAYVAKSVSRLQKIRGYSGELLGIYPLENGTFEINNYQSELDEIISSHDNDRLTGLMLSIGIVSNHGNWFTDESLNKELLVLKSSYDWLLFLSDQAMVQFVTDLLIDPAEKYLPISDAFKRSYAPGRKQNVFTKVKIDRDADTLLTEYFDEHRSEIESDWLSVLQPEERSIGQLRDMLETLYTRFGS